MNQVALTRNEANRRLIKRSGYRSGFTAPAHLLPGAALGAG